MDFSTFDFGIPKKATKAETVISVPLKVADEQIKEPGGQPFTVTFLAPGTPEATKEMRKWGIKWGREQGRDYSNASEDELMAAADRADDSMYDMAARLLVAWSLTDGEKPVDCTRENCIALFHEHREIAAATMSAYHEAQSTVGK